MDTVHKFNIHTYTYTHSVCASEVSVKTRHGGSGGKVPWITVMCLTVELRNQLYGGSANTPTPQSPGK